MEVAEYISTVFFQAPCQGLPLLFPHLTHHHWGAHAVSEINSVFCVFTRLLWKMSSSIILSMIVKALFILRVFQLTSLLHYPRIKNSTSLVKTVQVSGRKTGLWSKDVDLSLSNSRGPSPGHTPNCSKPVSWTYKTELMTRAAFTTVQGHWGPNGTLLSTMYYSGFLGGSLSGRESPLRPSASPCCISISGMYRSIWKMHWMIIYWTMNHHKTVIT